MGAEEAKAQMEFEGGLTVGDKVLAMWTNSGYYYQATAEVVAVNRKSFRVRTLVEQEGYPVGHLLNLPRWNDPYRWSWNNRVAPSAESNCIGCQGYPECDECEAVAHG